jgi:hypothetical protein
MMLLIAIAICYDCLNMITSCWSSMYVQNMLICSNKMIGECIMPLLLGCMYSSGSATIFMMIMVFSIDEMNTKL